MRVVVYCYWQHELREHHHTFHITPHAHAYVLMRKVRITYIHYATVDILVASVLATKFLFIPSSFVNSILNSGSLYVYIMGLMQELIERIVVVNARVLSRIGSLYIPRYIWIEMVMKKGKKHM